VIILASYYTICDIILLLQIYFYRWDKKRRLSPDGVIEDSPLLERHRHEDNANNSRRRIYTLFAQYSGALILVCASGVISWWISTRPDFEGGTPQQPAEPKASELTIQLFGWTSAILYLGSRVPQILKNFETKCEGLSVGLFIFAIAGNSCYALSIIAASTERQYLVRNGSWLAGSLLTIGFDVFVLCQFFHYRSTPSRECVRVIAES